MEYEARYTAGNTTNTIRLDLDAATDKGAVDEINELVAAGLRNEAQANVTLSDGRVYGAINRHGHALGGYVANCPDRHPPITTGNAYLKYLRRST